MRSRRRCEGEWFLVSVYRLLNLACLGLTFLAGVEVSARVDDRVRHGIPFWKAPDRDADLVVQDDLGIRGRPNGRFKQWKLNAFGFRSAEISKAPAPGCTRVMTLGASETFGLYERDGREYPAQLGERLRSRGCYEVVNAAIYGMTLADVRKTWNNWGASFKPQIVTIYPTPSFYLAPAAPGPAPARTAPFPRPPWWSPRSLERARDVIDYPDFIQNRKIERDLAAVDAGHPTDWFFRSVPAERLARYERDLDGLVGDIQKTGAYAIVMAHANGFHVPPRPEELPALRGWRSVLSRPTTEVLLPFEDAARNSSRRIAAAHGAGFVDLAGELNGQSGVFAGDLLHFSEEGASRVASILERAVLSRAGSASESAVVGRSPATPYSAGPGLLLGSRP